MDDLRPEHGTPVTFSAAGGPQTLSEMEANGDYVDTEKPDCAPPTPRRTPGTARERLEDPEELTMPKHSPSEHDAKPNSITSKRVPASSLSSETTASEAQQGEGAVIGGLPDASSLTKVVSK